jgi:Creatinase/Prolidase N-terminal domain
VQAKMAEKKTVALVLSALDEIAWFLNLRGSDINFNPVFFAYVIVTPDSVLYALSYVVFSSLSLGTLTFLVSSSILECHSFSN